MTIATAKILPNDQVSVERQTWQAGSWETFLALSQQPTYQKAKAYYFQGAYQFTMGVGANHGDINAVIFLLLSFYCTIRNLPHKAYVNTSYRKDGIRECQPDLSYYFLDGDNPLPAGSSVINLNEYAPPDLAIEIADSSLADDLGMKRLLYEEMQVKEYWVVDVSSLEIFAFAVDQNLGSRRIQQSVVLEGLAMDAITEALHKSQELDNAQLGQWWMGKIKP
ncbi:Uma2 family endonuclease [Gloeomargaritales cyanobacterium VI4D9]|nr:Uma2 family endonuclease [Gloeomargaritales cyanobacterium VI4D9]